LSPVDDENVNESFSCWYHETIFVWLYSINCLAFKIESKHKKVDKTFNVKKSSNKLRTVNGGTQWEVRVNNRSFARNQIGTQKLSQRRNIATLSKQNFQSE